MRTEVKILLVTGIVALVVVSALAFWIFYYEGETTGPTTTTPANWPCCKGLGTVTNPPAGAAYSSGSLYPNATRFLRFRPLDTQYTNTNYYAKWVLPQYNAQQVISMISDLSAGASHGVVLQRFTSGPLNPNMTVPVCSGCAPMNVAQFLNASMYACRCYILPRLSMTEYDKGTLLQESQNLLSLPIYPKFQIVVLDLWANFAKSHTAAQEKAVFQELYAQGWKGIGVNECGGYASASGYVQYAETCVDTSTWQPAGLQKIHADPTILATTVFIDYPGQVQSLLSLPANQEAGIISNLAKLQSSDGYWYMYSIVQPLPQSGMWDCSTIYTSKGAPYNGQSLYQIQKALMAQYD